MRIRQPAVAGSFYSGQERTLRDSVAGYVQAAWEAMSAEEQDPHAPLPKALIAPHAGYDYSGPVAGSAYARIKHARGVVTRVVLAGPVHRVPVRAVAISSADGFATPLGVVPVDKAALEKIRALPQVEVNDAAHGLEHSLETHLPFLQCLLGPEETRGGKGRGAKEGGNQAGFSLVPLAVGDTPAETTAAVYEALWGGRETLFVISTDLSHFHAYEAAQQLDAAATRAIEALQPEGITHEQACGRAPMAGLLLAARQRGLRIKTLDLRNSGDTAGGRERVVGYGAWALYEEA